MPPGAARERDGPVRGSEPGAGWSLVSGRGGRGFAGTPTAVRPAGTDFVTHAPAPITLPSPIRRGLSAVPLMITAPVPIDTSSPITTQPDTWTPGASVEKAPIDTSCPIVQS